ncbi:MAG: hypothetical protein KL787_07340 [Taibaiella sp.]|nr:hypothetical protein [Taibaiella sp.]
MMAWCLPGRATVDSLNAVYAPLGISFVIGNNPFIIEDPAAPGGRRKMKDGELIILSAGDSIKCGGWGSIRPIPDAYSLDLDEIGNIQEATFAFNKVIADNASRHNLALFDAHTFLKSLASGIVWNGAAYGTTYISGGLFALDWRSPQPERIRARSQPGHQGHQPEIQCYPGRGGYP